MSLTNFIDLHIFIFIFFYFVFVYALFYFRNKNFLSSNVRPEIKSLDALDRSNNILKLPVVKTGLCIQGFPIFDTDQNVFLMNCTVWFRFNRSLISLENIEKF
jgi:hypothetical protein